MLLGDLALEEAMSAPSEVLVRLSRALIKDLNNVSSVF